MMCGGIFFGVAQFPGYAQQGCRHQIKVDRGHCCSGFLLSLARSEEHTSELQSQSNLVCRLLLEKKKKYSNHNKAELVLAIFFYVLVLQAIMATNIDLLTSSLHADYESPFSTSLVSYHVCSSTS